MDDEYSQDDEEQTTDLCEWCGQREADTERLVPGFGFLRLCSECALRLLASIIDDG